MHDINELLIKFNSITDELIECLNIEEFEKLESLMEKRQEIIGKVNSLTYDKEEFSAICSELGILNKQKECEKLMNSKKTKVKEELKKISVNKGMNRQYNHGSYVDSIYFNKKI